MGFEDSDGFEKKFQFGSEDCVFVHGFEAIGDGYSEFSLFLCEELKVIESGLLDEYFFVSKEDMVLIELFFEILVDDFVGLPFKVVFSFEFVDILVETKNVVIQLVELCVEFLERSSINVSQLTDDN